MGLHTAAHLNIIKYDTSNKKSIESKILSYYTKRIFIVNVNKIE